MPPAPGPPAHIPTERLFRSLLSRRPEIPIRFRLQAAPSAILVVRAVTSLAFLQARDRAEEADIPPEARAKRLMREVLAEVLWTGGRRAFANGAEVGALMAREGNDLGLAVLDAIDTICPTFERSDVDAWISALKKGAEHPTNRVVAASLGGSVDIILSGNGKPIYFGRPERYFGLPTQDLLDGHLMAFAAARQVEKTTT